MSNDLYPTLPGITWPLRRTPVWKTTIKSSPSAREWRSKAQVYPRYRVAVQYAFLRWRLDEFQQLFGFFNDHAGAFDSFLFSDRDDNTATAQVIGVGDGSNRNFQLMRTLGGFIEPVYEPIAASLQAHVNGANVSGHVDPNGLLVLDAAPAAGAVVSWSGPYLWRMRFDMDELDFTQFMARLWSTGQVKLITVKP